VGTAAGFLAVISAAVTPVVMVSACAILITGVGAKHAGLSDRIRDLAGELRATPAEGARRELLRRQLRAFNRRATFSWLAHCLLYLACITFSATVLTALLGLRREPWGGLTLALFVLGILLLLSALLLELAELLLAQATLRLEVEDALGKR
jgi:hypothetical protein